MIMKIFVRYLILVLLGVTALDGLNRLFIETAYANLPEDSELRRSYRYISDCNAELVILGASRGVYDYNTVMLADSLHVTCQCLAIQGMSVVGQYVSVKKAIEGKKTKLIIYDLSNGQISDDWIENRTSCYYPFYWKNSEIKEFIEEQQGLKMRLLLCSSFIQYNSVLFDLFVSGYLTKSEDKNGYIALPYTGEAFEFSDKSEEVDTFVVNPIGERYLLRIINECKQNGIRLILCDSPRLNKSKYAFDRYIERISMKNQVEFWNYSDFEPILTDTRFFYDQAHINGLGADVFTKAIIDRLRDIK